MHRPPWCPVSTTWASLTSVAWRQLQCLLAWVKFLRLAASWSGGHLGLQHPFLFISTLCFCSSGLRVLKFFEEHTVARLVRWLLLGIVIIQARTWLGSLAGSTLLVGFATFFRLFFPQLPQLEHSFLYHYCAFPSYFISHI